jgi:hypothetical protein
MTHDSSNSNEPLIKRKKQLLTKKETLPYLARELWHHVWRYKKDILLFSRQAKEDMEQAWHYPPEGTQASYWLKCSNENYITAQTMNKELPALKKKAEITSIQAKLLPEMIAFLENKIKSSNGKDYNQELNERMNALSRRAPQSILAKNYQILSSGCPNPQKSCDVKGLDVNKISFAMFYAIQSVSSKIYTHRFEKINLLKLAFLAFEINPTQENLEKFMTIAKSKRTERSLWPISLFYNPNKPTASFQAFMKMLPC